jgi:hypothetical protein
MLFELITTCKEKRAENSPNIKFYGNNGGSSGSCGRSANACDGDSNVIIVSATDAVTKH